MMRFSVVACGLALLAAFSGAAAQDEEGDLLRYKFQKGEKFTANADSKFSVEIEEMPEEFQGLLGEDPIDINFKMTLDLEVTAVDDQGKATLEGKVKKLSVKGNMVIQELDFEYDSEKDSGDEPDEPGEDPGFGFDLEGAFRSFVKEPVKLSIDKLGNIKMESQARGMGGGMAGQFLTLNGFMGALPEKRVNEGDTWKSKSDFGIPNLPFQVKIESENKYAERGEVDGQKAAVIKSAYTVATGADDGGGGGGGMPFQMDAKLTGKGEGETSFAIEAGRVIKGDHKVDVNVDANMENPSTGDEMHIKAKLTIKQALKLEKWQKSDY